jgi:hypothetical protein
MFRRKSCWQPNLSAEPLFSGGHLAPVINSLDETCLIRKFAHLPANPCRMAGDNRIIHLAGIVFFFPVSDSSGELE